MHRILQLTEGPWAHLTGEHEKALDTLPPTEAAWMGILTPSPQ